MQIQQGPHFIDDTLTFSVTTHRFDTGALTDADAVPAYRVYEDETGAAILAGNMAKLDDANTTGFYSEQITLSAANGFEAGKSYNVYVSAAVNSVTGAASGGFKVSAALVANVTQISGDGTAADNAEAFFDGTGYAGTNNVIPTVTTLTGHTAQTGDAYARLGAPAGASIAADIAAIEAQTDDIGAAGAGLTAITNLLPAALVGGRIDASVGAMAANVMTAAAAAADLTTELQSGLATAANLATVDTVVDAILALLDDARGEPGQGAPPASADAVTKLDYLYKLARNKITQDATTLNIYADDGTTIDHKATVSDDGTTYTRGELATGA